MPLQHGVHAPVQFGQLPRILADQVRSQLPESGPDAIVTWDGEPNARQFLESKGAEFVAAYSVVAITDESLRDMAQSLGVKEEDVKNASSFVNDLGADSLDTVELVMALEEEFETEIPDEAAEKITTVQQAIDYINSSAKA